MANKVSRFLAREDVILELDATDKGQALERIARFLEQRYGIKHEPVYRALLRREQIGATGIGHGIAIPHARIAGITQPMLLVARTRQPIKFGAPDHQPVSTLFVIVVPEQATEDHLQLLATVSEMFFNEAFRHRFDGATEPEAVWRLFDEWVGDQSVASGPSGTNA